MNRRACHPYRAPTTRWPLGSRLGQRLWTVSEELTGVTFPVPVKR